MNLEQIEEMATQVFSAVKKYVNREMGEMRKYVDGQITTVKKQDTKQSDDALIAKTKEYVRCEMEDAELRILAKVANSDAESVKSLERRASRHAEHLSRLEDRMRAQEQKGR